MVQAMEVSLSFPNHKLPLGWRNWPTTFSMLWDTPQGPPSPLLLESPTSTQNLLRKAKSLRSLVCKAATHYIPTEEIRTMCNFLYNIYTSFSLYYPAS